MREPTLEENQPLCSAVSPSGDWTCSLIKGHKHQQHVAYESHEEGGYVLEMWCDDPKPAPESEDEAFERWWTATHPTYLYSVRDEAKKAWQARARLYAGGK